MKGYNDFNSVDELKEFYHLSNINESCCKDCKKKEDEKEVEDNPADEKKKADAGRVLTDHLDVVYAKHETNNIFKHLIIFTNNRDPKSNKTLNNIYDAVDNLKKAKCDIIPELHIFVADETECDEDDEKITIRDSEGEYQITDNSNVDTLVFSRLGVQGEDECEYIVKILQDRGFLVLNPVRYSELACNKYDSAVLFKNGDIPQPNFCLMTKDILYDDKLYIKNMKDVYKEFTGDGDKDEKLTFVVKILDGHGGTGVMLLDGKKIMAVLQTIFAIDRNRQLIIQKKEEADGGDIRVHVLTLRNRQVIMAAMKRVKIKSDFRSNVSLGASAEPVKLTPEQEQIALKTAKLSHLPWCAVDIMPLVKGSNPEIGDNVVLEINASPGTAGITEVIGFNFVNIILNELSNPSEFYLQEKTAGYIETMGIDFGDGPVDVLAKLDTGNGAIASHIEVGDYELNNDKVKFNFNGKNYEFKVVDTSKARTGDNEDINERIVIEIPSVTLGLRKCVNVKMGIVKVRNKSTNALINRELLAEMGYAVSPSFTHILTKSMEKVKIV